MTSYESIEMTAGGDGVAYIVLSRPDILNRVDLTVERELTEAFTALDADPAARAILLSSSGRVFSAGGDTRVMIDAAGDLATRMAMIDGGRRLRASLAELTKPLVVALAGNSYGASTSLILSADAIVTYPEVEIADPHVLMALVAGDGGCALWPLTVGMLRARRHLLTGDPIRGELAYQLGMVTDLVPDRAEVLPAATKLAGRLAALPPLGVQLTKRALNRIGAALGAPAFDLAFYLEALSFGSEDMREAVAAFHEKRAGQWKGR
jgi:enoyl-CoA hydratase